MTPHPLDPRWEFVPAGHPAAKTSYVLGLYSTIGEQAKRIAELEADRTPVEDGGALRDLLLTAQAAVQKITLARANLGPLSYQARPFAHAISEAASEANAAILAALTTSREGER